VINNKIVFFVTRLSWLKFNIQDDIHYDIIHNNNIDFNSKKTFFFAFSHKSLFVFCSLLSTSLDPLNTMNWRFLHPFKSDSIEPCWRFNARWTRTKIRCTKKRKKIKIHELHLMAFDISSRNNREKEEKKIFSLTWQASWGRKRVLLLLLLRPI
jgi:hypothetical protein